MRVEELLKRPEGKTLEFKQDLSAPKNILKSVIAFANTAGGTVVIGRADDGTVVGVGDVLDAEERLANLIADSIAPGMMPEIEAVTVADKALLLVRVAHWPGPFYLKAKGPEDGVFVRLGSTNRQADAATLEALRRLHHTRTFDQLPCAGTDESDLDQAGLQRWFAHQKRPLNVSALESLGIVAHQGGRRLASNAGVILFGTTEARQRCFPDARISCARFLGRDKSEFLDRQDMDGLLEALVDVPKFIARNTRLASRINGMQREDVSEYSAVALREVLVNAVAHADYALSGMRFFVSIFSDRLEIQSPGMFPFGMTLENFKAGVSRIRNRAICRVLREMGFMEEWGSGYQRIIEACRLGGYPEPQWQELGACIRVVFPSRPQLSPDEPVRDVTAIEPVSEPVSEPVNERQRWFLDQLGQGVPVNAEGIVQRWGVSLATAKRDIAALRQRKVVEFSGAPKTGVYRLTANKEPAS
ncbi:ATP-binding protein [Desulfonatronum thioautotrophicum]|uniref:ATP-binding protein n=1 Tax=Desulfonatronum thioautotrophicum TaxID=617001 RepID=UPI00069A4282|nr:ATP-binding protein [Desulfonatronum thioautotrophicum]